ncbi:MAG: 1-acyl-sn-glycerol-3-phosphate acyltransferase, partial [Lachnospiraceae bacterium]|nr:1-acyl-sn-glycerol-3-phosphate acyltransferase [Lachnospiraceae bacterium]
EQREKDAYSGERLMELAVSEITNVNNFYNLQKKEELSEERKEILKKIAQYEREGRFDEDVEKDPPAPVLMPEDIDYLHKGLGDKLKTKSAYNAAHWFVGLLLMKKQMIIKEIIGLEHFKNLDSGAIITCNHFNPFDSFAVEIAFEAAKQHKKRKMYRVIREGNYTGFPGFYGFLMRNCNTLPLSSNLQTMKKFMEAVDELLGQGHFILVYPEQSMWWNYRKPKPLKAGAYKFAAKNNVPVLPCFITMDDSDVMGNDGFYVQEYTIHIEAPIYPDKNLSRNENIENMRKENYEIWKNIYEDTYQMKLAYTYDVEKII